MTTRFLLCAAVLLAGCAEPAIRARLADEDEAVGREAVREYAARGEAAIPELYEALADDDPLVRTRARTALGSITGQWGSDGSLVWKRSVAEATGREKPILVLHLFGRFDEEFC